MRVSTSVVAAVVSVMALSAAAPIPARQALTVTTKRATARSAKLACNGATEPGKPIRVSPAINAKLKYTTVRCRLPALLTPSDDDPRSELPGESNLHSHLLFGANTRAATRAEAGRRLVRRTLSRGGLGPGLLPFVRLKPLRQASLPGRRRRPGRGVFRRR
jgi:hypothetical protein